MSQTPTLGRCALLALVEWVNKKRSTCVESYGVGASPTERTLSTNQFVRTNSSEAIEENGQRSIRA